MLCSCSSCFFFGLITFLNDVQTISSGFCDLFVVGDFNLFVQVLALGIIFATIVFRILCYNQAHY